MNTRRFRQVDVFTATPYGGNPVAVVLDAEGLDTETMQRFADWTNLSETTFVLPPQDPGADYRLRIFTRDSELPFAGHPTLGSAHAWIDAGGVAQRADRPVQECGAGLIQLRATEAGLAFAAPLLRSGPVDEALLRHVADQLRVDRGRIDAAEWVDNGPGWIGVLLESAEAVRALQPAPVDQAVGVVGPCPTGSPEQFEVRAFFPVGETTIEDPVTGSLNAGFADWLTRTGERRRPTSPGRAPTSGGPAAYTSPAMPTAPSGLAAAPIPVSPARSSSEAGRARCHRPLHIDAPRRISAPVGNMACRYATPSGRGGSAGEPAGLRQRTMSRIRTVFGTEPSDPLDSDHVCEGAGR